MTASRSPSKQAKNILVLCGGGGTEHEISLVSSRHLVNSLQKHPDKFNAIRAVMDREFNLKDDSGKAIHLQRHGRIPELNNLAIDFVIPCIHGPPGETGEIQSILEFLRLPYLGPGHEAGALCFNKVSCKLWLSALGIPNTPSMFLTALRPADSERAHQFFKKHHQVFVKAASQGSSVGCYRVRSASELDHALSEAFRFSQDVLIEKEIQGRELEISVYEYQGNIHTSLPGEIMAPGGFYSYEEKYSDNSKTETIITAHDLSEEVVKQCQEMARAAFLGLKLRDLSRVDFFLSQDGPFINEINTFPGMTPISMFPKMMEAGGPAFDQWLIDRIEYHLTQH